MNRTRSVSSAITNRENGMTLMEVLVVMAIIALLAFMAGTWLFSHSARADLRRASRNLVTSFHFARMEAIKRNTPFDVRIAADGSGWTVVRTRTNATLRRFNLSTLHTPITIAGGTGKTFTFTGKGRPTRTSLGSTNFTDPNGEGLSVSISISGNIRVKSQ